MAEKTKTQLKYSALTYEGWFVDPVFQDFGNLGVPKAMYTALKPWNVRPQDIGIKTNPTAASDYLVTFDLKAKFNTVVNLALSGLGIAVDHSDWTQAESIVQLAQVCRQTLEETLKTRFSHHDVSIVMQLIPEGKSLREITQPFVIVDKLPTKESLDCYGFVVHTERAMFVVDKSALYPNGLFVRLKRTFAGDMQLPEMAKQLYEDETAFSDILGLEF